MLESGDNQIKKKSVLGFVLDPQKKPRFTVFVGTSTGSFIGTASILDRPRNQIMPLT
jgi:hypothetical protein